jgi:hypothetical protein
MAGTAGIQLAASATVVSTRVTPAKVGRYTVAVLLLTISRRGVSFLRILGRNASMAENPSYVVQGTLDMLILKTLALEPMHGYGIAVRLDR